MTTAITRRVLVTDADHRPPETVADPEFQASLRARCRFSDITHVRDGADTTEQTSLFRRNDRVRAD